MSGRLLDFSQYLGGADNVQVIEMFPRNQKRFQYNFGSNVSTYTFSADFQTIVLDTVTYDRTTGLPNFAETAVIGYFDNTGNIAANTYIDSSQASAGLVDFTIPSDRYTGKIFPNARDNVVMTVVAFQWQDAASPPRKEMHRWAIIERWEPGVTVGDPTLDSNFIRLGGGSIAAFTGGTVSADAAKVPGVYTVTGVNSGGSDGSGATFQVTVATGGATTTKIITRGSGYKVGDTITIYPTQLGSTGGGTDVVLTISSVI